ncbi:MAG TPA: insulinase family protein, partial [Chloroflexota bacterium]|nr:insulinase family protein [Chloroflexota bacterium]
FALDLLSAVLVEGMGSRLFAEIREERALAYDIGGGLTQFRDTGSFAVGGAVAGAALEPALETILATCRSLADNDLPEPELRRARGYVKGGLILGMEDSFNVASWFAREELLETERMTPEQAVERIDAVTPADIRRVAERIFSPGWAHLALVGPVNDISGPYRVLERGSGVVTNVAG